MLQSSGIPLPDKQDLKAEALQKIIIQKLEMSLAKKNGISANDFEINQAVNQVALRNKMTTSQMEKSILTQYESMKEYRTACTMK